MILGRDPEDKDGTLAMLEADDFFEIKERKTLHFLDLPIEIHWRFLNFVSDLDTISLTLAWNVITFIPHIPIACFESLYLYLYIYVDFIYHSRFDNQRLTFHSVNYCTSSSPS